jgi:hypothetical protein
LPTSSSAPTTRGGSRRADAEVAASLNNGRSGAVSLAPERSRRAFASKGIDQSVLDNVQAVWARFRESLQKGETFYVPDCTAERRLTLESGDRGGAASFAVIPVFDEETLVALLYVDSMDPHFCAAHDLERLTKFSRIVAKAVTDTTPTRDSGGRTHAEAWETYLERTPVEDMERAPPPEPEQWNIARSWLMASPGPDIYLRLQRYNIPRERVPKTRVRTVIA